MLVWPYWIVRGARTAFLLLCFGAIGVGGVVAAEATLKVAVVGNAPPMSYLDETGRLTGFSVGIGRAVCAEMKVTCDFRVVDLAHVVDALVADEVDFAAASLLATPQRREKIIFAKPYFRSFSVWFAPAGIEPGRAGVRVAVVKGSAQERYALDRHWATEAVSAHTGLAPVVASGVAQAALVPMITSLNLRKENSFTRLNLAATVMNDPEIGGDAAFGINPHRPELKGRIDAALDAIKRNGIYDRLNSEFLPFRVN